jgi:hypothetical protein
MLKTQDFIIHLWNSCTVLAVIRTNPDILESQSLRHLEELTVLAGVLFIKGVQIVTEICLQQGEIIEKTENFTRREMFVRKPVSQPNSRISTPAKCFDRSYRSYSTNVSRGLLLGRFPWALPNIHQTIPGRVIPCSGMSSVKLQTIIDFREKMTRLSR